MQISPMPGLNEIIGQTTLKRLIQPKIEFARDANIALPHLLFSGEAEQGKMTFAAAIADELGVPFCSLSAEDIITKFDLSGHITNMSFHQIFAIRKMEELRAPIIDGLVAVLSNFRVEIRIGDRTHYMPLPRFTFIGTTSKPWLVDERIRRWCTSCAFDPYTPEELARIVQHIAAGKDILLDADAAGDIAAQCKRPGEAEVLMQKIAGFLPPQGAKHINRSMLQKLNEFLGSGNIFPEILNVANQLRKMDGLQFEHWVADLFRMAGFQVEVTRASGDHGVDLWASLQSRMVAVQCKRWDGTVGEPVVRDLYGSMMAAKAHAACLITTGSFTVQAHQFSQGKLIHLISLDALMEAVKSPNCLRRMLNLADWA